jgi:hypothetical protein
LVCKGVNTAFDNQDTSSQFKDLVPGSEVIANSITARTTSINSLLIATEIRAEGLSI